ncbi:Cobyrinic acid ac-diamide synthase [Thiorhodococcus drewsii AZ1]|uniref:Cobyrinic acid ac-diamide synthase n=1 Tax=Thiorhodococcus drewsii AZ1 TaxID=765913 RepID=G2E0V2_9GAMM|nr:AAA family ATPase [Thiorhodococcus drewsii]EGV31724.1 Cobyrinic acid ac-diamide synthase [Thiorhodococcus drewsii AZ1]
MTRTLAERQPTSPEIIAVASQKGGVGKSTTALNLSIAFVAAGHNVLLMDLDPQGNSGYTLMSGIQASGTERMLREATLTRDMVTATEIPDLFLAPATPGLSGLENDLAQFGDSRTRLHQALATLPALPVHFDHIVIDCPPSVGLLTLNALAAAHQILLPLPCDAVSLESLPALLQTIERLRAGLKQPLHGVHLLLVQRAALRASEQAVARTLRQDYGHLVLRTEIPYGDAVREAADRGRPLLAHNPHCNVSQAYLELACECLLEYDERLQPENSWSFRGRQERMEVYRDRMLKRIRAWLVDPTSLLYDETWESRHLQDALVLNELFTVKRPPRRGRFLALLLFMLALSVGLLLQLRLSDLNWWSNLGEPLAQEVVPPMTASEEPTTRPIEPTESKQPESAVAPDRTMTMADSDQTEGLVESKPSEAPLESDQASDPLREPPPPDLTTDPPVEPQTAEQKEPVDSGLSLTGEAPRDKGAVENTGETAESDSPDQPADIQEITLTPSAYRWQVQVLAGRSLDKVKDDSQRFMREFSSMLEGRTLTISPPREDTTASPFYRLRVLDWGTRSEAANWCARLRARGQQCFVIGAVVENQ